MSDSLPQTLLLGSTQCLGCLTLHCPQEFPNHKVKPRLSAVCLSPMKLNYCVSWVTPVTLCYKEQDLTALLFLKALDFCLLCVSVCLLLHNRNKKKKKKVCDVLVKTLWKMWVHFPWTWYFAVSTAFRLLGWRRILLTPSDFKALSRRLRWRQSGVVLGKAGTVITAEFEWFL